MPPAPRKRESVTAKATYTTATITSATARSESTRNPRSLDRMALVLYPSEEVVCRHAEHGDRADDRQPHAVRVAVQGGEVDHQRDEEGPQRGAQRRAVAALERDAGHQHRGHDVEGEAAHLLGAGLAEHRRGEDARDRRGHRAEDE